MTCSILIIIGALLFSATERPVTREQQADLLAAWRPPIEQPELLIKSYYPRILGVTVPDVKVCDHHAAPADFFRCAFDPQKHPRIIVRANRTGMKSLGAALITWTRSRAINGYQTNILGGSGEQSRKVYQHTLQFWGALGGRMAKLDLMKPPMKEATVLRDPKSSLDWLGGSQYACLKASHESVRGGHPHCLIMDEADEIKRDIYDAAYSQPWGGEDGDAQWIVPSTVNHAGGLMEELMRDAEKKGWTVLEWCWKETTQTCHENCSTCPISGTYCDGEMHSDKLEGYLTVPHILHMYNGLSTITWESEWCCLARAILGAVLSRQDLINCYADVKWKSGLKTWMGIDWGYTADTVVVIVQSAGPKDLRIVGQIRHSQMTAHDWAREIAPIYKRYGVTQIYADASHPGHIQEFERLGMTIQGVPFGAGKERPLKKILLEALRVWTEKKDGRRLLINQNLESLCNELEGWHYKEGVQVEQIAKEDDHGPDATLCAMMPYVMGTARMLKGEAA